MIIASHDELPSTMDAAHRAAAGGAPHGAAVWARRQTEGRGSRGRNWSAGQGGLWLSVVARPDRSDALDTLSIRVGLAVAAELEAAVRALPRLGLKWPNDLHLLGRKVGGILCEARWHADRCQWVVIGVGINVHNVVAPELHAIALADVVDAPAVDDLVEPVAGAVARAARNGGALERIELDAFATRDVLRGRRAREPVCGVVDGITPRGALRVVDDAAGVTEILGGLVVAHD